MHGLMNEMDLRIWRLFCLLCSSSSSVSLCREHPLSHWCLHCRVCARMVTPLFSTLNQCMRPSVRSIGYAQFSSALLTMPDVHVAHFISVGLALCSRLLAQTHARTCFGL